LDWILSTIADVQGRLRKGTAILSRVVTRGRFRGRGSRMLKGGGDPEITGFRRERESVDRTRPLVLKASLHPHYPKLRVHSKR